MHSSFAALRSDCPMQLLYQYRGFEPSPAVLADLARIETLWALARARHGRGGPWLFGVDGAPDSSSADSLMARLEKELS